MNSDQGLKKSHSKGGKGEYISSMEWNEHSLGDMNQWPQSFRTSLNIVLNNSLPAFLLWEDELFTFPNKKFVSKYLSGTNQKKITGLIAQTALPEIWKLFKNETENLYKTGEPFEKTVHIDRLAKSDSNYYNLISLNASPVNLEDGSVGGMIVICMDVMPNYIMANELKDRIKEQETLQNISQLRENFNSVDDYLSRLASLIPPAMQFPNIAEAAIDFNGNTHQSENYGDCNNAVFSIEEIAADKKLKIHIGYTQETSQATKSSVFVRKDKELVQTIAEQAALTIHSHQAKKSAEQTKQKSEQLLDRITDGYIVVNNDWCVTDFNKTAEKLLDKRRADVVGKQLPEIFPEVKSLSLVKAFKTAVSKKTAEAVDFYHKSTDTRLNITIYPEEYGISVFISDISHLSEQKEQYNQLSNLVHELQNSVIITDSENRVKWVNDYFTKLTGFTRDEILDKTIQQLLPGPETDLKTLQKISDNLAHQVPFSEQILYYTKEGDEFWVREKVTPVFDDSGSLKEYITIHEDISRQMHLEKLLGQVQNMAKIGGWDYEIDGKKWIRGVDRPEYLDGKFVRIFDNIKDIQKRKELEGQFNQSRKLLEALVEQADAGLWVVDGNRDVILMNEESKKIFDISGKDVIGKPFFELIDSNSAAVEEYINQVADSKLPKTISTDVSIDSEERTYLTNIFPLENVPGLSNAVGAIYTNITRLKRTKTQLGKTEQKLQEIIDHSTNLFYSHTPDHVLTYLSPQSEDFLGLSPEEVPVKWTDLITDHPVNDTAAEITRKAIETGDPQPPFELQLRKTNGEIIWVEAHESPIVKNGETIAIAGSLTDITKRKKTEDKLKESLSEKETLLSEIHHRVKNNLAIVSGLMQLQAFSTDNEEFAKMLNVSVSRMRSIAGIHEQLYQSNSFSTIDLAENLKRLITEVINTMQIPTNIHQDLDLQSVSLSMDQALPCTLIVNEVVTNILKHAFVDSEEGTISVHLSEKNNRVTLVISDNGVGLPDDFDIEKSDSLGMELINTLSEQLGAVYSYGPDTVGTRFDISFNKTESS